MRCDLVDAGNFRRRPTVVCKRCGHRAVGTVRQHRNRLCDSSSLLIGNAFAAVAKWWPRQPCGSCGGCRRSKNRMNYIKPIVLLRDPGVTWCYSKDIAKRARAPRIIVSVALYCVALWCYVGRKVWR